MNYNEKIKIFQDVFAPKPKENVLFLVDIPHNHITDTTKWKDRRAMAHDWYTIFKEMGANIGFSVHLREYNATGMPNAPLPKEIIHAARHSNLVISMTEYSASSSLLPVCFSPKSNTRCASMPGIEQRMEETALRADYKQVKQYATKLAKMLNDAIGAKILFSTGDNLYIDLRNRVADADTGECTTPGQFINFPSGEACKVPYEAAHEEINQFGESKTEGTLPVNRNREHMKWIVKKNQITDIFGNGKKAKDTRQFLNEKQTRRNIAELGIGCNPYAVITGNVLEDEKVGLHIAYGMSTHLGGKITSDIHDDICYAKGCPVEGTSVVLFHRDGSKIEIIRNALLQYDLLK